MSVLHKFPGGFAAPRGDALGQFVQTPHRMIVGQWDVCEARQFNEGAVEENNLPENTRPFEALEIPCEGTQYVSIANLGVYTGDDPAYARDAQGGRLHIYPDRDGFSWGSTSGRSAPQIVLEVGGFWTGPLRCDVLYLRARQPTAYLLTCLGLSDGIR